MKTLKGNEDFLCINKNVNIFDIISCKEEQASQIIAWLLNPREAHNFGNEFFEAMLNAASSNSQLSGYKYNDRKFETSRIYKQSLLDSYNEVIIQTEYCIDKNCKNKKEGRVDILLCLEKANTIFVIENKYGSKEHGKQASNYFKHFSNPDYKNYKIFYFYLDINACYENDKFKFSDDVNHWYFLDYNWIIDFLKKRKYNVPASVYKIIQDIIVEFDGYENEKYFDCFYNNSEELFKEYGDDIKEYRELKPYPYSPISGEKPASQFVLYNDFYGALSQYSNWDSVFASLNEKDGYVISGTGDKCRAITAKRVDGCCTKERKYWPFYINLRIYDVKDEENDKIQQNLEIKIVCTNEYITTKSKLESIKTGLTNLFKDNDVSYSKYVLNNIKNIKSYNSEQKISFFYLQKDIIEDFNFSDEKIEKIKSKIYPEYYNKLDKMYNIFFPNSDED